MSSLESGPPSKKIKSVKVRAVQKRVKNRLDSIKEYVSELRSDVGMSSIFMTIRNKKLVYYSEGVPEEQVEEMKQIFKAGVNLGLKKSYQDTNVSEVQTCQIDPNSMYTLDLREEITHLNKPYKKNGLFNEEMKPYWWPDNTPYHSVTNPGKDGHVFCQKELREVYESFLEKKDKIQTTKPTVVFIKKKN